ncbi:AMP-binding protein [Actinomadura sp. NPDC049753]|uniref:AMP-binding protein n=1 Tax=Actinomadura sp. NPDC049753 TaxID=3154739 RepID=UPI003438353F
MPAGTCCLVSRPNRWGVRTWLHSTGSGIAVRYRRRITGWGPIGSRTARPKSCCVRRSPKCWASTRTMWAISPPLPARARDGRRGGAYLPIDPALPAGRVSFMIADAGAVLVLGTREVAEDLPAGRVRVMALDDPAVAVLVDGLPVAPLGLEVPGGALAYVMYTSGSTGRPKGVGVTQKGLASYVASVPPAVSFRVEGKSGRFGLLQAPFRIWETQWCFRTW